MFRTRRGCSAARFVLTGEVVKGAGIGRRFTFPTLNLVPEQEILPAQGVYVTRTRIEGES